MGTRQDHENGPADGYLRSPHTSSCKKLFALLLVQESLGTKVTPKQKQFKQPIWKEDKERRRKAYFIFCTANHFYIIPDCAIYHSRDCEAWIQQERAVFVSTVCSTMRALRCLRWKGHSHRLHSISIQLHSTHTLDYPGLWGREVKCFHVKSVFIRVAYKEESS